MKDQDPIYRGEEAEIRNGFLKAVRNDPRYYREGKTYPSTTTYPEKLFIVSWKNDSDIVRIYFELAPNSHVFVEKASVRLPWDRNNETFFGKKGGYIRLKRYQKGSVEIGKDASEWQIIPPIAADDLDINGGIFNPAYVRLGIKEKRASESLAIMEGSALLV